MRGRRFRLNWQSCPAAPPWPRSPTRAPSSSTSPLLGVIGMRRRSRRGRLAKGGHQCRGGNRCAQGGALRKRAAETVTETFPRLNILCLPRNEGVPSFGSGLFHVSFPFFFSFSFFSDTRREWNHARRIHPESRALGSHLPDTARQAETDGHDTVKRDSVRVPLHVHALTKVCGCVCLCLCVRACTCEPYTVECKMNRCKSFYMYTNVKCQTIKTSHERLCGKCRQA